MLEMTLFRLQMHSVFSHCWPCDFILQLFELCFCPPSFPCAHEGQWVSARGRAELPLAEHGASQKPVCESCTFQALSSAPADVGTGPLTQGFTSELKETMKQVAPWAAYCSLSSLLKYASSNVRKAQALVSFLVFSSVFVDYLDTDNCKRIPDKKLTFAFISWA